MSSSTDLLTGRVFRKDDSGYEAARLGWNHLYASHPEAVVFCAETPDVVNALTWARHNDIPVRVRGGRRVVDVLKHLTPTFSHDHEPRREPDEPLHYSPLI